MVSLHRDRSKPAVFSCRMLLSFLTLCSPIRLPHHESCCDTTLCRMCTRGLARGQLVKRHVLQRAHSSCHPALTVTNQHARREVAERYREVWRRDRVANLVVRLRQNVLRAGLARMGAAYSRISLADVAAKLGVATAADAESIVAKVVRCGGRGAVEIAPSRTAAHRHRPPPCRRQTLTRHVTSTGIEARARARKRLHCSAAVVCDSQRKHCRLLHGPWHQQPPVGVCWPAPTGSAAWGQGWTTRRGWWWSS
jgi:PCI domain